MNLCEHFAKWDLTFDTLGPSLIAEEMFQNSSVVVLPSRCSLALWIRFSPIRC